MAAQGRKIGSTCQGNQPANTGYEGDDSNYEAANPAGQKSNDDIHEMVAGYGDYLANTETGSQITIMLYVLDDNRRADEGQNNREQNSQAGNEHDRQGAQGCKTLAF
jgi:hypothetical protein